MTFNEVLSQTIAMLQQHGRVSYRALKRQFAIDDECLENLKCELIAVQQRAVDQEPLAYTPAYLAEKILASRSALEGERKQVTVLFADLKDSTELIRGLAPEAAQQLLDPRHATASCLSG